MELSHRQRKGQSDNQRFAHLRKVLRAPRSRFQQAVCEALLARRQTLGEFAAEHFPQEPAGTINEAIVADRRFNKGRRGKRETIRLRVAEILGIDAALAVIKTQPRHSHVSNAASLEEHEWNLANQIEATFGPAEAAAAWDAVVNLLRLHVMSERGQGHHDRADELECYREQADARRTEALRRYFDGRLPIPVLATSKPKPAAVIQLPEINAPQVMAWWNALSQCDRDFWLRQSAIRTDHLAHTPAGAFEEFQQERRSINQLSAEEASHGA